MEQRWATSPGSAAWPAVWRGRQDEQGSWWFTCVVRPVPYWMRETGRRSGDEVPEDVLAKNAAPVTFRAECPDESHFRPGQKPVTV